MKVKYQGGHRFVRPCLPLFLLCLGYLLSGPACRYLPFEAPRRLVIAWQGAVPPERCQLCTPAYLGISSLEKGIDWDLNLCIAAMRQEWSRALVNLQKTALQDVGFQLGLRLSAQNGRRKECCVSWNSPPFKKTKTQTCAG